MPNEEALRLIEDYKINNIEYHYFKQAEILDRILALGYTHVKLCEILKHSQATISNKIRLLKLPAKVKKLAIEYKIKERHARALLETKSEATMLEALEYIKKYEMTTREVEDFIRYSITPVRIVGTVEKVKITPFEKIKAEVEKLRSEGFKVRAKPSGKDVLIRIYDVV